MIFWVVTLHSDVVLQKLVSYHITA